MKQIYNFTVGLVVILAVVVCVIVFKPFNKDNETPTTQNNSSIEFCVKDENNKILNNDSELIFVYQSKKVFNVTKDFEFNIVANTDQNNKNFSFTLDEYEEHAFYSEESYNKAFTITKTANRLVIVPKFSTVNEMLTLVYPSREINVQDNVNIDLRDNMFNLNIKEKNGTAVYNFYFGVLGLSIETPTSLVF